jgi:hypothetical protein
MGMAGEAMRGRVVRKEEREGELGHGKGLETEVGRSAELLPEDA